MKFKSGLVTLALSMLVSLALFAPAQAQAPQPAQPGQGMNQWDPVTRLNRYLQSAGTAQLSDTQAQQLTTLITNYRAAHPWTPDQTVQSARKDLETAILAGNESGANTAADAIASGVATRVGSMIRDVARFEIQVLSILTPDQVNALKTQYGNSGLIHTLGFLAGGFGHGMGHGFGRGMGHGMGPGMGR